jgi:sugar/nucleoside kinase (ribokinase family)
MLRAALEERSVTARLAVDGERPTGSVVSAPGGLAVDRGATAALAPGDLPEVLRAGAVLVSGYALFQPGSAAACRAALARADAEWVAVDAGSTRAAAADTDAMEGANALLTDAEAARALTGLGVADAAAVLGQSFQLACVTQGAAGASASLDGEVATVPAPRVQAVDAVGAGDAFAAGLLIALLRSEPLSAALEAGCLLGARAAASDGRWPA